MPRKIAEPKSKPRSQHAPPRTATWWEDETLLPATFEWDAPARLLPTRRDAISLPLLLAMDRAVKSILRAAYEGGKELAAAIREGVAALHQAYSEHQAYNIGANAVPVRCGRGCARCCSHYVVSVHAAEILSIHDALRRRPDYGRFIRACRRRVASFAGWREFVEKAYAGERRTKAERYDLALEHYYDEDVGCPFLAEDGACGIYDVRPLSCRMYLASSSPDYCATGRNTLEESDIFTMPVEESVAIRLERLDRVLDDWGHDGELFSSLVRLHEARKGRRRHR